jgi:hypothetical protein
MYTRITSISPYLQVTTHQSSWSLNYDSVKLEDGSHSRLYIGLVIDMMDIAALSYNISGGV